MEDVVKMGIKDIILDLLFPQKPYCISCNALLKTGESLICSDCASKVIPITLPVCTKCGKPLDTGMSSPNHFSKICSDCREAGHRFIQARSYGQYEGVLKRLIFEFKYRRRPDIAGFLGEKMTQTLDKLPWPPFDYIVPVPLHRKRLQERGYNQALLLAKVISKTTGIPIYCCLVREKPTEHQTLLDKRLRQKNLEEAFTTIPRPKLSGKKILLIDDVYTTGSTADACTKAILCAGAEKTYILTCARG